MLLFRQTTYVCSFSDASLVPVQTDHLCSFSDTSLVPFQTYHLCLSLSEASLVPLQTDHLCLLFFRHVFCSFSNTSFVPLQRDFFVSFLGTLSFCPPSEKTPREVAPFQTWPRSFLDVSLFLLDVSLFLFGLGFVPVQTCLCSCSGLSLFLFSLVFIPFQACRSFSDLPLFFFIHVFDPFQPFCFSRSIRTDSQTNRPLELVLWSVACRACVCLWSLTLPGIVSVLLPNLTPVLAL